MVDFRYHGAQESQPMEAPIRKLVRIKTMATTAHNTTITLEECQLLDLENWGERVADECGGRGVAPIMCGLWMQIHEEEAMEKQVAWSLRK